MNTIELSPVPLTLTGAGVKPTIPKRKSAVFGDPDFNTDTDLMVSQWAYNVDEDIWYYRSKKNIKSFGQLPTIDTTDKVFLLTYDVMLGTSTNDFEFIPNTSVSRAPSASYDLLVIKTPGRYVFIDEPYLSKTLHVEVAMTTKNLNKIISLVSPNQDLISNIYSNGIEVYPQSEYPSSKLVATQYGAATTIQEIEFMLILLEDQQAFPIAPIRNINWYQPQ